MTAAYEHGNVPPIEVRHRLRIAREFAGLEQDQLAEMIGVSRGTIGNAEKGRVKARDITINAWALACGVPRSWIKNGTEPEDRPDGGPGECPHQGSNLGPADYQTVVCAFPVRRTAAGKHHDEVA